MEHWFDGFTKRLAVSTQSRSTFLGGVAATVAVAATASSLGEAIAAAAARRSPAHGATPFVPKSESFGPCSLTTAADRIEHHFSGSLHVSGHAVAYKRTRLHYYDAKRGSALDTTIVLDGKPVLEISSRTSTSSTQYQMKISNAFGVKQATLITDDGKTIHGEVDGRALLPFVPGPDTRLKFADGKPFVGHPQKDVSDAISAAFSQAAHDVDRCVPGPATGAREPSIAFDREAEPAMVAVAAQADELAMGAVPSPSRIGTTQYFTDKNGVHVNWFGPAGCGTPLSAMNGNAVFNPGCIACGNRCTSNSNACEAENWAKCVACFFTGYGCMGCYQALYGCSSKDYSCLSNCNATRACLGQVCAGWNQPAASLSPYLTCSRRHVCVSNFPIGQGGYCCPDAFPVPCPGSWPVGGSPGGDQTLIGLAEQNNFCCFKDDVCLELAAYGKSNCQNGNFLFQCCPKKLVCGHAQSAGHYKGYCCPPGTICYDGTNCCNPLKMCPGINPGETSAKPGAKKTCCENLCHNGLCCNGKWCGDTCCAGDDRCGFGGKCLSLCLSGQRTIDGRCCESGSACGTKCCPSGCKDPKTSTCRPARCPKGLWKCTASMPNSNATEIVCCPKGQQCYNGKCCPPHQVVCQNPKFNWAWGCWPTADCQAPPK